ncbi:uncharacterized protein LOC111485091 isoform X1 [Cucurbita maxima]|uniref:Uncharacterized protein LOC111485091 isoform X1 n=1 Tax=Cucurbita maxima TaxID=3661 RepID=A0A6J1JH79_CUCMA|nr:uncharacterized protein LOC111485091 isoform X1 [Cucurbita maxima]
MQGRAMGGLPVGLLELYDPDAILLSADEIQAEDSNVARICLLRTRRSNLKKRKDVGKHSIGYRTECSVFVPDWSFYSSPFDNGFYTSTWTAQGTYSNIARTNIGDNFDCEVLHISIWNCVQTPSHRKAHITCGNLFFMAGLFFLLIRK